MKVLVIFFLALLGYFGYGQSASNIVQLQETLPLDADQFIGYDKFDYLYFVKNNVLYKSKNQELFEYKNLPLGQITKVDLLNPLKVIVLYERFNTVITLDSQLNETLKVDFSQLKEPLVVSKTGIAAQNQLWVFDELSQQLFLYDTISGILKTVGTPLSAGIIFYSSDFNTLEWIDKDKEWYQCSIFGNVKSLTFGIDYDSILFSDNHLFIYQKGQEVLIFNKKSKNSYFVEKSMNSVKSVSFKNQILSIFTAQEIRNYKITIP